MTSVQGPVTKEIRMANGENTASVDLRPGSRPLTCLLSLVPLGIAILLAASIPAPAQGQSDDVPAADEVTQPAAETEDGSQALVQRREIVEPEISEKKEPTKRQRIIMALKLAELRKWTEDNVRKLIGEEIAVRLRLLVSVAWQYLRW